MKNRTAIIFAILLMMALMTKAQTKEQVKNYLDSIGVQHSEIVTAQSILETGHYESRLCKEQNNIFGWWYKGEFLSFDSWRECCDYYKRWQDKYYRGGDYYEFLMRIGYAEDEEYITKLTMFDYIEKD